MHPFLTATMNRPWTKRLAIGLAIVLAAAGAAHAWKLARQQGPGAGFVSGNGRIEATEIDIATKLPGRVAEVFVEEGDTVQAGQVLARMDDASLLAQQSESLAREQQARDAVAGAQAQLAMRHSDRAAAAALVVQRSSDLDAARRRLARSAILARDGASSLQELDDDRARVAGAEAALAAARAQRDAAGAAITAAEAQVIQGGSAVRAAAATTARIDADLRDTALVAPRAGRVQYRVAQPGEVLGAGGKVLNMIDLKDVYMTFFVPETVAGRIALGTEVRLRLDAAPGFVVPAAVAYIASSAQFTPKSVETASERQKLMFRVKAQVNRRLLERYPDQVKAGVPGVAWVRIDPAQPWPPELTLRREP